MVKPKAEASVDPTTKYRLSLPVALHSVSASLSALHAARALAHHPETSVCLRSTHCPKCGTYLFPGIGQTQLSVMRRNKKKTLARRPYPAQKAFLRTCHACGATITCEPSATSPRVVDPLKSNVTPSSTPPENQTTLKTEPPIRPAQVGPHSASTLQLSAKNSQQKAARRKASTLQEMLAHERRKAETTKTRKVSDSQGGLASFLHNL